MYKIYTTMASFKLKSINQFNKMEMAGVLLIAIFILFPIRVPAFMNSTVSYIALFGIAVYLFMNANPVLGVLFLFVIYEIMRRANAYDFKPANELMNTAEPMTAPEIIPASVNDADDILDKKIDQTLEEEFVNTLAPIGHSETPKYDDDNVRPVNSNTAISASLF